MILRRFCIVTDLGGHDYMYHLVSERVWEEYSGQFKRRTYYDNNRDAAYDDTIDRLFPSDVHERMIDKPDIDNDVLAFTSVTELYAFCRQHAVDIVEGD